MQVYEWIVPGTICGPPVRMLSQIVYAVQFVNKVLKIISYLSAIYIRGNDIWCCKLYNVTFWQIAWEGNLYYNRRLYDEVYPSIFIFFINAYIRNVSYDCTNNRYVEYESVMRIVINLNHEFVRWSQSAIS